MSILSKLKQPNLSKEGKEAIRLREQYIQNLLRQGLDENDLTFKTTEELKSMTNIAARSKTKSLEERDRDRIFEYRMKQLSK